MARCLGVFCILAFLALCYVKYNPNLTTYTNYKDWSIATKKPTNEYRIFSKTKSTLGDYRIVIFLQPNTCVADWYLEIPDTDIIFTGKPFHQITFIFSKAGIINAVESLSLQPDPKVYHLADEHRRLLDITDESSALLQRLFATNDTVFLEYKNHDMVALFEFGTSGFTTALQTQHLNCFKAIVNPSEKT